MSARRFVVTLLLVACSEPESLTPAEFCRGMVALECTTHACCTLPSMIATPCDAGPAVLAETCDRRLFGTLATPSVRWDGLAAAAALERMRAQAASCTPPTAAELPGAFITGLAHAGDDCVTGLGSLTRGAACAEGICDPMAGRCVVPGPLNQLCYDDLQCGDGLFCPDAIPVGLCTMLQPTGIACDTQHANYCASGQCGADSGIPPADGGIDAGYITYGTCIPPLPDGTPCGEYDICDGWCVRNVCTHVSPTNRFFCQPPPPPPPPAPGVFG
jgi:hypothetical protein